MLKHESEAMRKRDPNKDMCGVQYPELRDSAIPECRPKMGILYTREDGTLAIKVDPKWL